LNINLLTYAIFNRILNEGSEERSAGVVIVQKHENDTLFLALVKENGKYDITKGIIETGEDELTCAVREAKEESGIILTEQNFKWGFTRKSYGKGVAFIAASNDTPVITPNPETGILEHIEAKWVSFDEMLENVSEFLIPAIKWANNIAIGDSGVNV
jgi:8-oxo-dGTP pyrophosphatase MutT (NUDIX family)